MIRSFAKSALRKIGYEVHKTAANQYETQKKLLSCLGIFDPTIFDVGAHIGETVEHYKTTFSVSRIYCFEPFSASVKELAKRYKADNSVIVVPLAVSDSSGSRLFHTNQRDATNSLLPRPEKNRRYYPRNAGPKAKMPVDVTTIDDFVAEQDIKNIHILKLDIQGGELMALRGAIHTLTKMRIPIIYTEAMFVPHYEGNPLLNEIWSFLADLDYSLMDIYDLHRATNGQLRYGDALFVSRDIRENCIDTCDEEP